MLVIILVSILGFVRATTWTDTVNTTTGLVRGVVEEDLVAYRGIPYATVNEENPFGLSSPHHYMDGIFDAVDDTSVCPQREEYNLTIVGSLDCLHLNVYVPHNTTLDTKLPVLVYIYGGGLSFGFSREIVYGPKFLVRHDIILVIFNYRLGPYGFMCLDTEDIPGNQGLKDQVLALQWVNKNIERFGGDADNVSIMGNSAGALSVDLHMLSKTPKVYNKIIMQSASATLPSSIGQSDDTAPLKLAEHLGFKTNDIKEAISFLARTHTDLVIAATLELQLFFMPCVEKELNNVERFIHVHPRYNDLSTTDNIKVLAGFNSHEVLTLAVEAPETITDLLFPETISIEFDIRDITNMARKVRRFYIGDEIINAETSLKVIDFLSDFSFNYPVQRSIINYINKGLEVFQYVFSYNGDRNYIASRTVNFVESGLTGAVHADELGYLFDMIFFPYTPTPEDQIILDRMTTMWTNFIKFGDPTPSTISELIPVVWPPATRDVLWYLDINSTLTVSRRPYHERMIFWDLFYVANEDNLRVQNTSASYRFHASFLLIFLLLLI